MDSQSVAGNPPVAGVRGAGGGVLMAVASMSFVQLALALSVHLFDRLGPLGVAGLRLGWAGVLLLVLVRSCGTSRGGTCWPAPCWARSQPA
jgi:threonine/homoserine efflux transporter RhtA